jgi:Fe-S cluster assembly protein SufD
MKFLDITEDKKTVYTLKEQEQCVFFLWNRGDNLVFELTGKGAAAHIFAFFSLDQEDKKTLSILQHHQAPETTSHVTVKSVLRGQAECFYDGTIRIDAGAVSADASQESRTLLLSQNAKTTAKPTLEILEHDVRCHHAATVSPLNQEALFLAQSRGLSKTQAEKLLVQGFLNASLQKMSTLLPSQEQEKMVALGGKYFSSRSL